MGKGNRSTKSAPHFCGVDFVYELREPDRIHVLLWPLQGEEIQMNLNTYTLCTKVRHERLGWNMLIEHGRPVESRLRC